MKLLVKTTGPFMLMFPTTGEEVPHNRPAVVTKHSNIDQQILAEQIKVLSPELLPDTASDVEFAKFWADSAGSDDREALAVAAFLSTFESKEEKGENKEEKKADPKKGAKPG